MKRPRDSQRKKVYVAERVAFEKLELFASRYPGGFSGDWKPLDDNSIQGTRRYVRQVIGSKRWATLVHRYDYPYENSVIKVKDGRGCTFARGGSRGVTLPVWARSKPIVLHELAHTLTFHEKQVGPHGWLFCRAFLDLVGTFIGADAKKELKASFRAHKVRTSPRRVEVERLPRRIGRLAAQSRS